MKTKGVNTCKMLRNVAYLTHVCWRSRGYGTHICHRWIRMNRKVKMDPILHFVPPIEGGGLAVYPFLSCKTPVYPTLGLLLCKRNSIQMYSLTFLFPFAQICYHFLFAERKTWSLL